MAKNKDIGQPGRTLGLPRRDFMRVTGAAVGGIVSAEWFGANAEAAAPSFPGVAFAEAKRIPLGLDNPSALATAPGKTYVAGENAVVVLDATGKEMARYTVKGRPGCLAVTPDGKLLVGLHNHVEVLDSKGVPVAAWQDLGERAYLTSMVADEDNVYVADAGNRVVVRFDHGGQLKNRIGEKDAKRGISGLVVPSPYFDVAIDPMGALWVVNPGKHGLENYRPNGDLVSSWYRSGMEMNAFCGCCNPIHIAFRSNCTLVTAEKGLNRVKVYAPDTSLLGVVSAPPVPSVEDNKALFCNVEPPIMDLAVDEKDRILLLNKPEKGIVVYDQE